MAAVLASRSALKLACVLGAVLAGCASAPKPIVTTVAGSIEAVEQLNPSVARRPSPVQLRIYELKSAAAFNAADFMSLYQGDLAVLGAELVAREEMTLRPGESRPYAKTLAGDTRFIGIVAAYRDLERSTWRTIVPVQLGRPQKLTIRAGESTVSATMAP